MIHYHSSVSPYISVVSIYSALLSSGRLSCWTAIATTVRRISASEKLHCSIIMAILISVLVDPSRHNYCQGCLLIQPPTVALLVESPHGMKVHGQSVWTRQDVDHAVRTILQRRPVSATRCTLKHETMKHDHMVPNEQSVRFAP